MNICIFGGMGFLGHSLVRSLFADGHNIYVVDSSNQYFSFNGISFDLVQTRVEFDGKIFEEFSIEAVLYLASKALPGSIINSENIGSIIENDFALAIRWIYLARERGVKKYIYFSSGGSVYADGELTPSSENYHCEPINFYGSNKLAVETHGISLNSRDFSFVSARVSNPYYHVQLKNKGQGIIPIFLRRIKSEQEITVFGDGLNVRDYIYMDDLTDAVRNIVRYEGAYRVFNVGSGVGHTIIDVISYIEKALNISAIVKFCPARSVDKRYSVLDIQRAWEGLGWAPKITLEKGIEICARRLDDHEGFGRD